MTRFLYRIGHFGGRHPWRILAAWLLIAVTAVMLSSTIGGQTNETFRLPGAESQRAADALEDRFPQQTVHTSNIVFHSEEGLTTPEAKAAVATTLDKLADVPQVINVADPYDARGPTVSRDGKTAFARVAHESNKVEPAEFGAAETAAATARDAGLQVEYDGLLGDAEPTTEPASELIGLAVAVVVLAIAFGSIVAMSVPLVVALVGLLIGTSTIGIMAGFLTVPEITTIVAMMMGLGVGIDYALFILARHRQHLAQDMPVPEAVGHANATAGLSVLFAGITVIVAIAGLQVAGIPMLTMMGWGAALMVAVTMLAAVTLLPAVLGLIGRKINGLRLPLVKLRPADNPDSFSARWAAKSSPARSATAWSPRCCSGCSRHRSSRCVSASPTPATSPRPRPCASPTTCSPRAMAQA